MYQIIVSFVLILVSLVLLLMGFFGTGNVFLFVNWRAIAIVLGGTFIAAFISFPPWKILQMFRTAWNVVFTRTTSPEEIVEALLDLSVRSKYEGILALQNIEDKMKGRPISRALGMMIDGYGPDEIRDILLTEMQFFKARHAEGERVFRVMAGFAPAFGLIGSIAGLIMMTTGIADEATIQISVGICLLSTLYGILFANVFLTPMAEKLKRRTSEELLLQRIILDGVLAIQSEANPYKLEMKLKSFISPSARKVAKIPSIKDIQRRFKLERANEKEKIADSA
jgi:chemotaxis protein MotA